MGRTPRNNTALTQDSITIVDLKPEDLPEDYGVIKLGNVTNESLYPDIGQVVFNLLSCGVELEWLKNAEITGMERDEWIELVQRVAYDRGKVLRDPRVRAFCDEIGFDKVFEEREPINDERAFELLEELGEIERNLELGYFRYVFLESICDLVPVRDPVDGEVSPGSIRAKRIMKSNAKMGAAHFGVDLGVYSSSRMGNSGPTKKYKKRRPPKTGGRQAGKVRKKSF